ncbi:hypothetical protein BS50DRAFT_27932 [Corynespora cassiicola Philippines]|uniref:Uncharacterized protein n=1 Tax=Corynespora cassiicola Philippines TaxID=1448308 RepID=A0A2T2PBC6_CORCC|nr:hypothetical protein BS50DRAFT_27932 [Corynespora cassiicola Philippines]
MSMLGALLEPFPINLRDVRPSSPLTHPLPQASFVTACSPLPSPSSPRHCDTATPRRPSTPSVLLSPSYLLAAQLSPSRPPLGPGLLLYHRYPPLLSPSTSDQFPANPDSSWEPQACDNTQLCSSPSTPPVALP